MQARHDINVNINGAAVLNSILPQIQAIAMEAVRTEMAKRPEMDSNSGRVGGAM